MEKSILDYKIEDIRRGFQRHMHNELVTMIKESKVLDHIQQETKELARLDEKRKTEIKKEAYELNQLLEILNKANEKKSYPSIEEFRHLRQILLDSLRNFIAIINKAISFHKKSETLKSEKNLVTFLNTSVRALESDPIAEDGKTGKGQDPETLTLRFIIIIEGIRKALEYKFSQI